MHRVQRSLNLLLEAAREDKPIYGLTRGVGENKDKTIFKDGQIDAAARRLSERFKANLLRVQATAFGAPASVEVVRAAMVIRLDQMLIGHAGSQQSVVQGLEDFLSRGITPVVPSKGTVGEADIDILARSRGHRRHCHECGSSGDERTSTSWTISAASSASS